jgi:UDP-N-acetyl-D-galactosamine dehydrogenase
LRSVKDTRIGIIGLGYVGLPLAVEFGKHYPTVGFDIKKERIAELARGEDSTLEATAEELKAAKQLEYSTDAQALKDCNTFIVTVPTPVGKNNRPVLTPLKGASETVGSVLKAGDVVVYESTVYPGCTEEYCVPILEQKSDRFSGRSEPHSHRPWQDIHPGCSGESHAKDRNDRTGKPFPRPPRRD